MKMYARWGKRFLVIAGVLMMLACGGGGGSGGDPASGNASPTAYFETNLSTVTVSDTVAVLYHSIRIINLLPPVLIW